MIDGAILRAKKLKGQSIVRVAAAHNKREIQAELGAAGSIDANRSHLNECLSGPPTAPQVADRAKAMTEAAGVLRLRKDAVRAIEFVVSLAPAHAIDDRSFFIDAVAWLACRFGGETNILSADIHRDEPAPHVHLLLLPLIDGRMNGSDALGGRTRLALLHSDFHAEVAAPYGLKRAAARLRGSAKAAGVMAVLEHLRGSSDPALHSAAWGAMRDCIERDPAPFLAELGIAAPQSRPKALRSMTAIFTSTGKGGAKPEADHPYRVLSSVAA